MISLKRLKQHWTAGPLACLLSAALALPVLLAWMLAASQPAQAQTLNRLPTWAVVSFVNTTGYGGNEVGIEAADGFVVELGKSNKYDVLPRAQTQQAIADLGLVEPLNTIGLQKLARSLEGDAVATGEVAGVSFRDNPRRATVTLVIRVVDRVSGELVNGAVAKGTSTPRPGAFNDDDALVNEAIANADFEAVRQISAFNLPRATVLIHGDPTHVTLNKGSQEGLYNGLNMVVTRNGSEVGRIRVSSVEADEADATVTDQGLGINTQDIATAIYQLPSISSAQGGNVEVSQSNHNVDSTTTGGGSARGFFSGPIGAILAGAVGVGIFALASGGRGGSSSGSNAIGGGRLGGQSAAITFSGAQGITAPYDNPVDFSSFIPEAVQINWNNGNLEGTSILQYQVYRDPEPPVLQSGINFQTPTATTNEIGVLPIFAGNALMFLDSVQDVGPLFVQKPDPVSNTNTPIAGNFYESMFPAPTPTNPNATITGQFPILGTGLLFGDRPRYRIEALYSVPNINTTTGTTTGTGTTGTTTTGTTTTTTGTLIYSLSEPVYTNYVSYIAPVVLSETITPTTTTTGGVTATTGTYPHVTASTLAPGTADNDVFGLSTGPDNIIVVFRSIYLNSGGGVEYVLDFSTDPNFSSNVHRYHETGPASAGTQNQSTRRRVRRDHRVPRQHQHERRLRPLRHHQPDQRLRRQPRQHLRPSRRARHPGPGH